MENPLISIIVSVYKGEKYLEECIESVLNQDYQNIEFIIVNDGSPDNSIDIIKKYAAQDSRIKVIDKENTGCCASRNLAIDTAIGEYLCVMDQDDIISPDYVSYLYGLIKENGCEISLTPTADKFFVQTKEDSIDRKQNDKVIVISGQEAAEIMLYHKFIIAPWNKMIKKSLLDDNNVRFNINFFNGEGFAYSVQAFQYAKKVALGQRKVYHYRVGDPNSGASVFKERYIHSSVNAQLYIKDTMVNPTPELLKAWRFSNWHTHCDALNVMVGCGVTKTHADLYRQIKKVCKRDALCALRAPISLQQKLRGVLFAVCPFGASKIINRFRIRKFAKA